MPTERSNHPTKWPGAFAPIRANLPSWTCPGKVESSLEVKGELDDEAATFHEGIRGGSGPTGGDQWTHATGDSGGSGCRAIDAGALDRPQPGSFGGGTRSSAAGRYGCRVEAASAGERD